MVKEIQMNLFSEFWNDFLQFYIIRAVAGQRSSPESYFATNL